MSRLTAAAMALTVTGGIAACSSSGSSSGSSSTAANNNTPITLFTDNTNWKDGFQLVGNELAKITGHNLKMESVPVQANFQQVRDQSLAAKPADIVKVSNGLQMQQVAATGNLTDLTSVWDDLVKKGWLDNSLRPYYSYKGKVYSIPMTRSYWVVFYNKKLFQQYNIPVPTTYAQFTAAAETLKAHGVTAIYSAGGDGWTPFIPWQELAGAVSPSYYTSVTQDQATFGDAQGKQVLQLWQQWLDNGWTTPYDTKMADVPAMMKAGKLGMFPVGTWENQSLKAAGLTSSDYGAFLMPPATPGGQQAVFFEGNGLGVPTRAADHAAAVQEIEAWMDPRVQTVWSNYLGDASPNITVPVSDPVIEQVSQEVAQTHATQLIRYFEAVPPTLVTDTTTAWSNFMLHPGQLAQTATALNSAATTDWALWTKQNS